MNKFNIRENGDHISISHTGRFFDRTVEMPWASSLTLSEAELLGNALVGTAARMRTARREALEKRAAEAGEAARLAYLSAHADDL